MKVLVVDDFAVMRKLLNNQLRKIGINEVLEAADGAEAMTILRSTSGIDLIITDWNMPNMNGYELLTTIRSDSLLHSIPVLMLSCEGRAKQIVEAVKAGVNGYMVKPFSSEVLKRNIQAIEQDILGH